MDLILGLMVGPTLDLILGIMVGSIIGVFIASFFA